MNRKILALIENSVGPRLLLTSRLAELGYAVTVVSTPDALRELIGAEAFDWVVLDEAAVGPDGTGLLGHLSRRRGTTQIVWLGAPPSGRRFPIASVFEKPLDYPAIVRFFSGRAGQVEPASAPGGGQGPPAAPERSCCSVERR